MSGVSNFGYYGYSAESGLGCYNNGHDPSPYWDSAYWHLGASPYWAD